MRSVLSLIYAQHFGDAFGIVNHNTASHLCRSTKVILACVKSIIIIIITIIIIGIGIGIGAGRRLSTVHSR